MFLPYTGKDCCRNSFQCTSRQGYNDNLSFAVKDKYKASSVKPGYNFFDVDFNLQFTPITM